MQITYGSYITILRDLSSLPVTPLMLSSSAVPSAPPKLSPHDTVCRRADRRFDHVDFNSLYPLCHCCSNTKRFALKLNDREISTVNNCPLTPPLRTESITLTTAISCKRLSSNCQHRQSEKKSPNSLANSDLARSLLMLLVHPRQQQQLIFLHAQLFLLRFGLLMTQRRSSAYPTNNE